MKNQQRPTPRLITDGLELNLHSIFPTVQGEGPYAGRPAIFVRLGGCNLQCPACDTEYTEGARAVHYMDLVGEVSGYLFMTGASLVVITGGEPFRQNISRLVRALIDIGAQVQIETNGMLAPQGFSSHRLYVMAARRDMIMVVSPKTHKLDGLIATYAAAFKYVITAGAVDVDGYPLTALDHPIPKGAQLARPPLAFKGPIYIQPADTSPEDNPAHLAAALASLNQLTAGPGRGDFRIGLQTHKLMGLA